MLQLCISNIALAADMTVKNIWFLFLCVWDSIYVGAFIQAFSQPYIVNIICILF